GCNGEYPQCIELMSSGAINVAPLITSQITLADAPHWFERLHAGDPDQMKVVVRPQR
ncbi:MAG TPA: galactitol-1-phosphate 5-dehydrogenase, partial [Planctomycetaceae bacterium]|nr:galactitol-1-phosphate 5-dehydrogenase [Planctomycetaceae bacterium]